MPLSAPQRPRLQAPPILLAPANASSDSCGVFGSGHPSPHSIVGQFFPLLDDDPISGELEVSAVRNCCQTRTEGNCGSILVGARINDIAGTREQSVGGPCSSD